MANLHELIIQHMQQHGHSVDMTGVCYGIACLVLQETMAKNMDALGASFQKLVEFTPEGLRQETDRIRELRKNGEVLSAGDLELEKLPAIFDMIRLHYMPTNFPEIFAEDMQSRLKQDYKTTAAILSPEVIKSLGGVEKTAQFCGSYNQEELASYFTQLTNAFSDSPQNLTINLSASNHTVAVTYDPARQRWNLVDIDVEVGDDVELMRSFAVDQIPQLVEKMFYSFSNGQGAEKVIFNSDIYSLESLSANSVARMEALKSEPEWQQLHDVASRTNDRDYFNSSLLFVAAANGLTEDVKKLLDAQADFTVQTYDRGHTPLSYAAALGQLEVVDVLMQAGANVNHASDDATGVSPFVYACMNDRLEVIDFLLKNGADIDAKVGGGYSPLMEAAIKNLPRTAQLLLERGADHYQTSPEGLTAFMIAAAKNNVGVVDAFLKAHTDIEQENSAGVTALRFATATNGLEAMQLLLAHQADVNRAVADGTTCLHEACEQMNLQAAKILMAAKADPYIENIEGNNSIDYAMSAGDVRMIETIFAGHSPTTEQISKYLNVALYEMQPDMADAILANTDPKHREKLLLDAFVGRDTEVASHILKTGCPVNVELLKANNVSQEMILAAAKLANRDINVTAVNDTKSMYKAMLGNGGANCSESIKSDISASRQTPVATKPVNTNVVQDEKHDNNASDKSQFSPRKS